MSGRKQWNKQAATSSFLDKKTPQSLIQQGLEGSTVVGKDEVTSSNLVSSSRTTPEIVRVMFIGTQVDTMSCKGADSVCCPLSCAFSLFLLCGKLEYLAQGRRNVRLRLALFHRAVHRADVAVHDADALVGAAGVFLRPLAYLDPLDEQPQ